MSKRLHQTMPDQRKNAGNIGDVVKHALLPELVAIFDKAQTQKWLYCETHAGFYEYPIELLHNQNGEWSGERKWAIGKIEPQHYQCLGLYGQELAKSIPAELYPGSIRLVNAVVSTHAEIHGRDKGKEQVASFDGKAGRIRVSEGDGYQMIAQLPSGPRLVFCDPFWNGPDDLVKVQNLLANEDAIIVWYPLSRQTAKYRKWQQHEGYSFVEMEFADYKPRKNSWSGQGNTKGAGLTIKGLCSTAYFRSLEMGAALKSIFDGQVCDGRRLDLNILISYRGRRSEQIT